MAAGQTDNAGVSAVSRAIFVDPLMRCLVTRGWRWPLACHLTSRDLPALHAFAVKLGLRRAWFQHRPGKTPHYDLNPATRRRAVAAGAVEISRAQMAEEIRWHRAAGAVTPERNLN